MSLLMQLVSEWSWWIAPAPLQHRVCKNNCSGSDLQTEMSPSCSNFLIHALQSEIQFY